MTLPTETVRGLFSTHAESLFASLSDESLENLVAIAEHIAFPKETRFIQQGETGNSCFLIISGRVRVCITANDGLTTVLNTLGPGEVIGEMSLLSGQPRSASVETLELSEFLRISRKQFQEILKAAPGLTTELFKVLCDRLVSSNTQMASAWSKELAYQRLVSEQAARPLPQ